MTAEVACVRAFVAMLNERGVKAHSTWEEALPRIVSDRRYTLLPADLRKGVFAKFARAKALMAHGAPTTERAASQPAAQGAQHVASFLASLAARLDATGRVASEHFRAWGFGEVYEDGYGVGYMLNRGTFAATVTSRHLDAAGLGAQLERALREMRALALRARAGAKL